MRFPTRARFERWLTSLPAVANSGLSCSNRDCPLARWLRQDVGAPDPYVRPDKVAHNSCFRYSHDGARRGKLPKWANEFAKKIDHCSPGLAVPVHESLTILRAISTKPR